MSDADALRAAIEADRPARHQARLKSFGGLLVNGTIGLSLASLDRVRTALEGRPKDLGLIDWDVLEQHGFEVRDGQLFGPRSWPSGAPPRPGSMIPDTARGEPAGGVATGLSVSEARREVVVADEFDEWSRAMREHLLWRRCQDRRAVVLAEFAFELRGVRAFAEVVRAYLPAGDPAQALWTEAEIDDDYPA